MLWFIHITSKTKLIAITHVSSSGGSVLSVGKIGEVAERHGILYFDINGSGVAQRLQEFDYYAFGKSVTVGSVSGTSNRYQYNGKEKQEEMDMYDYGARFYDPVIGRWNVIDGKSEKYLSYSPYHYTGNNPVRFYDLDGNEFSDSAWDWVKRLMEEIERRQKANNSAITEKKGELARGGLSDRQINKLNRQIGSLETNNADLEQVRGETAVLAASKQMYNVVESSALGNANSDVAATSFNFKTGAVDITISPTAGLNLFAHELLHGYQFETGLISLTSLGSAAPRFLLDKTDEIAGYQRQGLFGPTENSLSNLYNNHPDDSRTIYNFKYGNTSIADLLKQGSIEQLRNLSKIMKQALKYSLFVGQLYVKLKIIYDTFLLF